MIVWGGSDGSYHLNTGAAYDPTTDTWTPTSMVGAPGARAVHTAVWTGSRMIVWGGNDGSGYVGTGAAYDPATDTWTPISGVNAPSARTAHTAVWTGSRMIVWGGQDLGNYAGTGAAYDPTTDAWRSTSTAGAPSARTVHTAVWTGSRMIVWGGYDGNSDVNTGAAYEPTFPTDTWTPISTVNAPGARHKHTAVWTGSSMIIWGGRFGSNFLNTGGIYSSPGALPALSINDVSVAEGNSGTTTARFTVSLSMASGQAVTVGYATANGTATTADNDYAAASGTLTFGPGETTSPVNVTVNGDAKYEGDEAFTVNLSGPTNASIWDVQGIGTITNDDPVTYLLSISTNGSGSGRVTSAPSGIDCGSDCSESYTPGTVVTLTAEPDPSSTFGGWSGGSCGGTSLTCQLTMDTARTATATFASLVGAGIYTVSPCRVLDSREVAGPWGGQPLAAGEERTLTVVGACEIPATATALSYNITATSATANGHLRVYPAGVARPGASTVNFTAGLTRANNGIVPLGAAGDVAIYSGQASGSVHVIVDVNGYFE
jgi:hypothetical protein